jgi:hypothetical protein
MSDPVVAPRDALKGVAVALSVSESDDLGRLGLTRRHAEFAIGELTRAVLVAGGSLVYGGRVHPSGFTQFLTHEVRRYGLGRHCLTLCLAHPEHSDLSPSEVNDLDRELGTVGRLVRLTPDGEQITTEESSAEEADDVESSYTALRRYMAIISDARVVLGGRLADFAGAMPGVAEEALETLHHDEPLYVAGGFGGAAALVAQVLGLADFSWAPDDFPSHTSDRRITHAEEQLGAMAGSVRSNGLDADQNAQLACTHRPGDVASLVVLGLSRTIGNRSTG